MRLWSIHPCYLDAKGLVALWREALLAQKVLEGLTRGYRHHPQLRRFQATADPLVSMGRYLRAVADEADRRGYRFDRAKIVGQNGSGKISVTTGQLDYELHHLIRKLALRNPGLCSPLRKVGTIRHHPMFYPVAGDVEPWEVISAE